MWHGAPDPPYNNVIGIDPLLTDPANGDYSLQPGSPAWGYGCQSFRGKGSGAPNRSPDSKALAPRPRYALGRRDEITVSGSITEDTTWNADKVNVVGDVTVEDLGAKGAVRRNQAVKVLGRGEIAVRVGGTANAFSASAVTKSEAAGGSTTTV